MARRHLAPCDTVPCALHGMSWGGARGGMRGSTKVISPWGPSVQASSSRSKLSPGSMARTQNGMRCPMWYSFFVCTPVCMRAPASYVHAPAHAHAHMHMIVCMAIACKSSAITCHPLIADKYRTVDTEAWMHFSLYEHQLHGLVASPVIFLLAQPACSVHAHTNTSPHSYLQHLKRECRHGWRAAAAGSGVQRLGNSKLLSLFSCLQVIRHR